MLTLWSMIQSLSGSPRLYWSSCGVPVLFRSLNLSPNSSTRLLELHLLFGCESASLSIGCWVGLPGDSYARFLSASTTSIINSVRDFMRDHGMGLHLGQSLVGHSLSLCSIFVPALLVRLDKFWVEGFVGGFVY